MCYVVLGFVIIFAVVFHFSVLLQNKKIAKLLLVIFNLISLLFFAFWLHKFQAPEYVTNLVFVCIYLWIYVVIGLFDK